MASPRYCGMTRLSLYPFLLIAGAAAGASACSRSAAPAASPAPGTYAADSAQSDTTPRFAPPGWAHAGDVPATFRIGIDSTVAHGGGASAVIEAPRTPPRGRWAAMLQQVDATMYAGRRIRVSGFVRRVGSGTCEVFVRVDGPIDSQAVVLGFTGTPHKRLRCGREWTEYALVLDVPEQAERVVYAWALRSRGRMWVDDVGVLVVDSTVPPDPQPDGLPRAPSPTMGETWDPFLIGGKEKPDSTAVPTNLSFEK